MWQNDIRFVDQNVEPNSVKLPFGLTYQQKILSLLPGIIQYLPMNETSGLVANDVSGQANNGAYSGATLAQMTGPGASMGLLPRYDGVNDFLNLYSAAFNADFVGSEFTFACWFRLTSVASGRIARILVDFSNVLDIVISAGVITTNYTANGVFKTRAGFNVSVDTWYHYGLTVTDTNDRMRVYRNGVQLGATLTGIGAWTGSLDSTQCCFMASTTGGLSPANGYGGHSIVANQEWTTAQMLIAATAL